MRVKVFPREASAIVYMRRRFSYSINTLAQAFHRSPSLIHRILKFNHQLGNLNLKDLRRQIPDAVKKIGAARQRRQLNFFMELWMPFLLGETDKPP